MWIRESDSVENSRELTRRIGEFSSGTEVRFRILRDGRERTLRVELGERPDDSTLNQLPSREQAEASVGIFGMSLSTPGPFPHMTLPTHSVT